jgi:hypothetical protein
MPLTTIRSGLVLITCALLLLAASSSPTPLVAAPAAAVPEDVEAPPALQEFWKRWVEAKAINDDDELDTVVKRYRTDADQMLNVLLDDISRKDTQSLYFEIRLLAWSLDRVERTTRYISRARYVIDMDMFGRGRRGLAMGHFERGIELEEEARRERSEEAWDASLKEYDAAAQGFEEVKDTEFQIFAFLQAAQLEFERQRYWRQGQYMKKILAVGDRLEFDEPAIDMATDVLEGIRLRGIDPDGPESFGEAAEGEGGGGPGGRAMTSFAPNTEPVEFQLELVVPKKGLPVLDLPSFTQVDQFQLWQQTWVTEEGPGEFDFLRGGRFQPDGQGWILSRDGIETFLLDTNNDGEADARFAASSTPSRVEVPTVKGRNWPIMVCALGQRELMFDAEFNYAPTAVGARLRFFPATYWEGEVLGETWKVYDTNMDGVFGVAWENFDDLITDYSDDDHVTWFEPDAVVIGRSKKGIPLSKIMPVGEDFYRVFEDPRAETLSLQKMNMATGTVEVDFDSKVGPAQLVAREIDKLDGCYFNILPARRGKGVTLPVGTYQICLGRITKGNKTNQDQVRIYAGSAEPFKVEEGKTTKLEFGAPYSLTFRQEVDGDERLLDTRSIRVFGRGGLEYGMFFDDPLQPTVEVRTPEGKKEGKPSKLRKVGVGEWEVNTGADNILWFPYEYRVDAPGGKEFEMRLSQKSHALLGGPLESDWIR